MAVAMVLRRAWAVSGRLLLAGGFLVALWFTSLRGVDRLERLATDRMLRERATTTAVLADSISRWLADARLQAATLAERTGDAPGQRAQSAIDAYVSPASFGTTILLAEPSRRVLAASRDVQGLIGTIAPPCARDARGTTREDAGVWRLAEAARAAREPATSGVVKVPGLRPPGSTIPGQCEDGIGVAAPSGRAAVILLRTARDFGRRLAESASAVGTPQRPARAWLVADDALAIGTDGRVGAPERVLSLQGTAGPVARRERFRGGGEIVRSAVRVPSTALTLVVEEDEAVDPLAERRSTVLSVVVLSVVFGAVFVLVAVLDARRRRAHRRAEVAKSDFFSIAGHELRTPLTALRGFTETLSARWTDLDDERRHMLVERMLPQVRRLSRTIERTLTAASMQAEMHARPRVVPVDVREAISRVTGRFAVEAPLHTFDTDVEQGLAPAAADPAAFEQVIEHLVDNAVKYSPSGGTVRVAARRKGRHVVVTVEDEGVGLPSDRRRIFEPLVQGEDVDRRVHAEGGIGVGLFIVRTLVQDMGGSVRAEPRSPRGARLVVSLRAMRAPADARAAD